MYRFGYYYNTFKVRIINYTSNTFADPRRDTATATVVDVNAATGSILFPAIEYDPFLKKLVGEQVVAVNEADGFAHVTVRRKGGLQGNVVVLYRTEDGSAVASRHYERATGNLTWLEGDSDDKVISIKLIDSPSFNPRAPTRNFSVVLHNFTMFVPGKLSTPTYLGPNPVSATVSITDPHGPGVLELEHQVLVVNETAGLARIAVMRRGGSAGTVRVDYASSAGSAVPSTASPTTLTSCTGLADGYHPIKAVDDTTRRVLCRGGEASLFVWPGQDQKQPSLWDRKCVPYTNAGGHDGVIMWSDLTARVGTVADDDTSAANYWSWSRGQTIGGTPEVLVANPPVSNSRGRPVPFPFHGLVVWFDWGAATPAVKYTDLTGNTHPVLSFSDLGAFVDGANLLAAMADPATYNLYFITNGISLLHVGFRHQVLLHSLVMYIDVQLRAETDASIRVHYGIFEPILFHSASVRKACVSAYVYVQFKTHVFVGTCM
jgi:hypothetical protein